MIPDLGGSSPVPKDTSFDPTGLIVAGVGLIGGVLSAMDSASAAKRLERKLNQLSAQQKKDLEQQLLKVQDQISRMEIIYKTLAVAEHQEALKSLKAKKINTLVIMGVGFCILAGLIVISKTIKK